MENDMEISKMGDIREISLGYIGIVEKKMKTTI